MSFLGLSFPTFAQPLVLFALVVPVALVGWTWAHRWLLPSRRVVLPVDRVGGRSGWWYWSFVTLAECAPPLLLAVGIVLLAGPQRFGPPQQKRKLTNIQFAVDVSGSMTSPYGEGTRYDASMKAIDAFLDYRKGDAFGLTFFGDSFVHWVPLTNDPSAIKRAPPFMRPEDAPPAFGGTSIGNALKGCKKELLSRDEGDRMILLVSDGISYDLHGNENELSKELADANITVFCVIAAEFDPQPEVVTICRNTGGEAFRADDPEVLKAVFKKIDAMKQTETRPTLVETIDDFRPYTLAGLVLVGLGTLFLFGLRYTPW